MTIRLILLAAAFACGLAACAPAHIQPEATSDLEQLQTRLTASDEKLDQLSQQVALLQTMVDRHQRSLLAMEGTGLAETQQPAPPSPTPNTSSPASIKEPPVDTDAEPISPFDRTQETSQAAPVQQPMASLPSDTPESRDMSAPAIQVPDSDTAMDIPAPDAYQKAMETLKAGDYDSAADQFKAFAVQFPANDLADNALYWAGECNYTRRNFVDAIRLFRQVVEKYPSGSKVPDALLKIGYAYLSLNDRDEAATYLKQVIAKYPFSDAAAKAEDRLEAFE